MPIVDSIAPSIATVAPFTGPAAPFVLAAASLVALGASIYHLFSNYDPQKLHDTAVVEAYEMSLHTTWYIVTGEALPGIPGVTATTTPGNYGAAGINLFQASNYPNVPYPAGAPGVNVQAALQSITASFQAASEAMQRPESIPNIQGNYNYFVPLFQEVESAQASQSSGPLSSIENTTAGISEPVLLMAAMVAVVFLLR